MLGEISVAVPSAYLLGSVPTGLVVVKLVRGVDIRSYGSGRTGATNVLRTLGWWPALAVLGADVFKGALAVLIARWVSGGLTPFFSELTEVLAALAVIVGHNWPAYAGFRGGRGVATSIGTVLAIAPPVALFAFFVGILIILLTDTASAGSVLSAVLSLGLFLALMPLGLISPTYLPFAFASWGLLIFQHRDNIQRLLRREERQLGIRERLLNRLRRRLPLP